ncbi:transcriptional regulator [Streptomyces sp. NPDC004728]|uniref:transcriptional regulator n=1 Tax=Streptomyces sp. NPDC004728 TaxID=3154289 RepID=UPI0033B37750
MKRGLMARLHYLTRTDHSRKAARDAGLTVTDRTLKAWLEERRRPSSANLERIDAAYRQVRRHNVARHLLRRLNAAGGTRVEIHPLNQSQVPRPLQRLVEYRAMNVRRWDRIVEAWAAGDQQGLDDAWEDVIVDLVGVLASVSGMVLSLVSGLGCRGPGRSGVFYGVMSSDGPALVLDKQ